MAINLKTWAPLGIAIVLGTVAAKIGHDMLSRKPPERIVVQKVTQVVVAKDDLPPGAQLKVTDLVANTVSDGTLPPGAFDIPERLANRVTTVALRKGQPIYESMLAPVGSSNGLTAIVPDGMRAVTMEINEVSGVAGLIVPGCHVDVVTSLQAENGQMMSRTVARSLQIVAVGRKYSETPPPQANGANGQANGQPIIRDDTEAPMARSVTLLVTPKQAELIDLATHTGTPRLVLRGSRDSKADISDELSEGVTVAELRGAPRESWTAVIAKFFQPLSVLAQQPGMMVAANKPGSNSTPVASTQPYRVFRQVTIIRRTSEQTQQLEVPHEAPRLPNVANTDKSDAVPGAGISVPQGDE
jgi:pilus assembly protein CpaB